MLIIPNGVYIMGDVNLEIKLQNLDEKVDAIDVDPEEIAGLYTEINRLDSDLTELTETVDNNNVELTTKLGNFRVVYDSDSSVISRELEYNMKTNDFTKFDGIHHYIVIGATWSSSPLQTLALVTFSGGSVNNSSCTNIINDAGNVIVSDGKIKMTLKGKMIIYAI